MANTSKPLSKLDGNQVLQQASNDVNGTIAVDGFLVGKVGHKVTLAISTTSVANDTETYTFSDNAISLYQIKVIYADGSRDLMISAERIS